MDYEAMGLIISIAIPVFTWMAYVTASIASIKSDIKYLVQKYDNENIIEDRKNKNIVFLNNKRSLDQ